MKYLNSAYNAGCPICANTKNKLLYKVSAKEAATHFLVTHNLAQSNLTVIEDKIAALWNSKSGAVVACNNCGFAFADPFIAGDHEFYNLLPHANDGDVEHWKWEFDITLKKLASLAVNNKLKVIEIGASTGDFVKRLANVVPKENIFCLEHSEVGVASIRNAGIEAHSWNFHEMRSKPEFAEKFDAICLFQVLEHLDNLDDTFETFNAIVKRGGHLFLGVPNGRKIEFNELSDALLDMPPNHIGRYNKKSFEFLGERYQWQIEQIEIEPNTSLDVMRSVLYYQSLKEKQFPMPERTVWFKIKQYLQIKYIRLQALFMHQQLGDTLWVHYRKVG